MSILWTDSKHKVTSGTWINHSREIKRNNTNRGCNTPILDYCATNPNTKLRYHTSETIPRIHSDTSHLSELKARSISGYQFLLGYQNFKPNKEKDGNLHTVSNILKM